MKRRLHRIAAGLAIAAVTSLVAGLFVELPAQEFAIAFAMFLAALAVKTIDTTLR